MELRTLKTFQVVADQLNLTKAAELLGYTQPTITLQIQTLEKEIGHALFNRVGKKTFLTPAGKMMKEHVDKLFAVVSQMDKAIKLLDGPYGTLVVAAPEYYWTHCLSQLIRMYVHHHPQVKLKLVSCNSADAVNMITANEADIGIIAGDSGKQEIESRLLEKEKLLVVTSREIYEKHERDYIMEHYPFIYKESYNLDGLHSQSITELNYHPAAAIESSSEEAIKIAALNHTGVALISANLIKDELDSGALVPLHQLEQRLDTNLIFLKDRSDETTIRSFAELVIQGWPEAGLGQLEK
ncbi:LysR family transcriptional regulator [Brevibacillus choshinensis]|uniref:LysR family transcriptional regulator n=1 Tax=Brevibacillus choshinensis TaxID=54911 RepID=A0ABX7FHJ7_BRECH|nr:LysR family transcriptional regulator [Brevibacillus choshinensis]QRG65686.1 LysR family transcriptional regulator [Brevibacillus choshinensis]